MVESRPFAEFVLDLSLQLLVVDVPVRTDTLTDDLRFKIVYGGRCPGIVAYLVSTACPHQVEGTPQTCGGTETGGRERGHPSPTCRRFVRITARRTTGEWGDRCGVGRGRGLGCGEGEAVVHRDRD